MELTEPIIVYLIFVTAVAIPAHASTRNFWICTALVGAICAIIGMAGFAVMTYATGQHFKWSMAPILFGIIGAIGMIPALTAGLPFATARYLQRRQTRSIANG